ncbi:glycosyltransferase family 4 protein [Desulforhabdus sp. TSK]|uniref:glycosyltransferase family 4 protein n=1 Tax=Desulforhabdus sp. TSK TaxID=2925014 RepID=UPI001FC7FBD2|nr:glycosyltransferase family 4 protein [Desulforhabdus sp. TSK]
MVYHFPPLANSGTQRPLKFVNYLPDYGWEPIVLTVKRAPDTVIDSSLLNEVRSGTIVHRIPMLSDKLGDSIAHLCRPFAPELGLSEGIAWRLRKYFRFPDLYSLWKPTAVSAGIRLFRQIGFDAVYATGGPWTSLLVGRDIAQKTNCPYVADFRDLWSDDHWITSGSSFRERARHRAAEQSVLEKCNAVVTVTDSCASELSKHLSPQDWPKVHTITNGYDPKDFSKKFEKLNELHRVATAGKIRIVYTGVWKNGYGLEKLYQAFVTLKRKAPECLSNLELLTAGFAKGPASEMGLNGFVDELGRLSHSACIDLMKSADVLFLPIAEGIYQTASLPGKLFEYLGSGKPILTVVPRPSEVSRLFDKTGGGLVIPPGDEESLVQLLANLSRSGSFSVPPLNHEALREYQRRNLTGKLADVLNGVVARSQDVSGRSKVSGYNPTHARL